MLTNFDEAVFGCSNENSRAHIKEAITCYNAGAYRSSIVASYISVTFDLIEKLKTLASASDAEAQKLVSELDRLQIKQTRGDNSAISGLLQFERELIIVFRDKFQFFGTIEYDYIQRLVTDRNRCAHPTFLNNEEPYHPTAEAARLHIRNALDLVLTQEPRQGKAALNYLREIVTADSFPTEAGEVQARLGSSPLKNGRPALVRGFIDEVTFGAATRGNAYFKKGGSAANAVEAAIRMYPDQIPRYTANVGKILLETEPAALRAGAIMALRVPEVAQGLPEGSRPSLRSFVKAPVRSARARVLQRALKIAWLVDLACDEIKTLSSEELKLSRVPPEPEILDQVVEILSSVGSYDAANKACSDLLGLVRYLDKDQVSSIVQAAKDGRADLQGAFGFDAVLQVIAFEGLGKAETSKILKAVGLSEPKWNDPRRPEL